MLALREHYCGEGNASRRIATTKWIRDGQHYKNKRSLVFCIFLDCMQKMFNIYEEEGEESTKNAKLHELFKRVQHAQLQDTVKALKVHFDIKGITYTQAAKHLTAPVSELPEYHLTRKVSASSSGTPRIRCGGETTIIVILRRRGDASPKQRRTYVRWISFHRYYPNWSELLKEDKQCVLDSRCNKKREALVISNKFQT